MSFAVNASLAGGIALMAITLPVLYRILSSPFLLLLLSPLIILLVGLGSFAAFLFLAYSADKTQKGRQALKHATRPFAFSTPAAWQVVLTRSQWSQNTPQTMPPLMPEAPLLSGTLNDILTMIVRDFVLIWYKDISPSPSFPLAVSSVLHKSIKTLLDRTNGVDIAAILVKRVLPRVTAHVEQFRQSEIALRGAALERKLTQSDELDLLLANKYIGKGGGKLHPAIDNLSTTFTKQTEEMHLRQLVDKALPLILPDTEAGSSAFRVIVREIVVCAILQPAMEMLTDPDFWNQHVDRVAGAAIHQQKLITRVRNVLEAQSPKNQPRPSPSRPFATELITVRTDLRQFESFLRGIDRCSSLLDARRLKNDVSSEIRRTRLLLANHDKEDWINGEKTEDVVAFLDRLYTAKKKAEQRITDLGGDETHKRMQSNPHEAAGQSGMTLRGILRNPTSLSYFMEFMDRRNRSLLVQFWLTVESFKNPLESVESDESSDESGSSREINNLSATIREDVGMINDLYFLGPPSSLLTSISRKYVETIRTFAASDETPSIHAQRRVRKCVLLSQRQIERNMEQDFEEFQQSELWFKALGDTDYTSTSLAPIREEPKSDRSDDLQPKSDHIRFEKKEPSPIQRTASSNSSRSTDASTSLGLTEPRHLPSNIEVLMSPPPDAVMEASRPPLFNDPEDQKQREEEERMSAIKAALTDIIALDKEHEEKYPKPNQVRPPIRSPRNSGERHRRAIFDDEPWEVHSAGFDQGEDDALEESPHSFEPAGPGDLQLSYEISRLADKITDLEAQEILLDALIKKAELTGDTQEHKLLIKSKSAMSRSIRELQFQRQQYEQQESANRLHSERTKVCIVSSTLGEEGGRRGKT